ncbi:hypothetical protein BH11PSE5_BH11PSE5_06130 [soil metagenome]
MAARGDFSRDEILASAHVGIAVTFPKSMTARAKAEGRLGKADFVYLPEQDVSRCPAGDMLTYRYTNVEAGLTVSRS